MGNTNVLKSKTYYNELLKTKFQTSEKRNSTKKLLAFGKPIIKERNSNLDEFSINIPISEDYLHEAPTANEIIENKIAEAVEKYYVHQGKLIIKKLVDKAAEIDKIYPEGIVNVAGVSAAAGDDGHFLTPQMFQKAAHSLRANSVPGYKNGKYYLAIITPKQKVALLEDPKFKKFFNKTGNRVQEKHEDCDFLSEYLGIKFITSNEKIIVKGSGSTEAQAAIICGGNDIVLQIKSSETSYKIEVNSEGNKKLGSDSADIANLVGARIVAKWYSGFVVKDPKKIKLLCYRKEA